MNLKKKVKIFAAVSKDSIGYVEHFLILARLYQILISKILICFFLFVSYLFYSVPRGYMAKARRNVVRGGTVVEKQVNCVQPKNAVPSSNRT
jgi:hypothetical protein